MAISAYRQGKLKKSPLLGSSLATDPKRAQQRKEFMTLYGEAKERAGEGREGMVKRLSERYQKFGMPHVAKMRQLGEQRSALESIQPSPQLGTARKAWEAAESDVATVAAHPVREDEIYNLPIEMRKYLYGVRTKEGGDWTEKGMMVHAKRHYAEAAKKKKASYDVLKSAEESALAKRQAQIGTMTGQISRRRGLLQERANIYNRFLGV